jgi:hypothetical protein
VARSSRPALEMEADALVPPLCASATGTREHSGGAAGSHRQQIFDCGPNDTASQGRLGCGGRYDRTMFTTVWRTATKRTPRGLSVQGLGKLFLQPVGRLSATRGSNIGINMIDADAGCSPLALANRHCPVYPRWKGTAPGGQQVN